MSDDAQPPVTPEHNAGAAPPSDTDPWAAPRDTAPRVPLGKGDTPQTGATQDGRDLWAPPADDPGPGHTIASGALPVVNPSMHDQQTVTSMPSVGGTPPSGTWSDPSAQAPGGFPPPAATGAGPYAPPGAADPFAAPGAGEAVPPPPIAPDGPGAAYGYPGAVTGYGYPGTGTGYGYPAPVVQPAPGPGYYGWPGAPVVPSNGMGTAGLVLGIIADVIFCLWPVAIVVGILAVIFGAVGRGKAKRGEATNPGQALAGIICGVVGIALGIGLGALVIANP
ncbi:DUF4190 domain-containing protein [Streptomyces sp. NPDC093094]|uniref:DUF4190 domain-containing protein n=1 Tax=Streptomyces sp. NPDC093094 TaxID=3366026 RepID=UPI0037FB1B31